MSRCHSRSPAPALSQGSLCIPCKRALAHGELAHTNTHLRIVRCRDVQQLFCCRKHQFLLKSIALLALSLIPCLRVHVPHPPVVFIQASDVCACLGQHRFRPLEHFPSWHLVLLACLLCIHLSSPASNRQAEHPSATTDAQQFRSMQQRGAFCKSVLHHHRNLCT